MLVWEFHASFWSMAEYLVRIGFMFLWETKMVFLKPLLMRFLGVCWALSEVFKFFLAEMTNLLITSMCLFFPPFLMNSLRKILSFLRKQLRVCSISNSNSTMWRDQFSYNMNSGEWNLKKNVSKFLTSQNHTQSTSLIVWSYVEVAKNSYIFIS